MTTRTNTQLSKSIYGTPLAGGEEASGQMAPGPHGHEKVGHEILRVLCPKCANRVAMEPEEKEVKCPHCGTMVKRPGKQA